MEIIPVIDLLHGQVVRAQRGERHRYRPIRSQLCDTSEPMGIARALLELYPFRTLYIADLDAIQRIGNHAAEIETLHRNFPHVDLWLDAGVRHSSQWQLARYPGIKCIIGSEGLETPDQYLQLAAEMPMDNLLLSLDFNAAGFMGPDTLLQNPQIWPQRVICMALERVGSHDGPDFKKLEELSLLAGKRFVYAAGGIRHIEDLHGLKERKASGVLLASALHDGKIDAQHLAELMA